MITKERLLAGLQEAVYVEEGMITLFTNFDEVLVDLSEDLEEDTKRSIKRLLFKLHRDSTGHKETIDNMVRKIEEAGRNEY